MISPDTMQAAVRKLDCHGRTIWRLMATRGGLPCGLGHMLDFDDREDAENCAISFARRNSWPVDIAIYYTPGRAATSFRSFPGPLK